MLCTWDDFLVWSKIANHFCCKPTTKNRLWRLIMHKWRKPAIYANIYCRLHKGWDLSHIPAHKSHAAAASFRTWPSSRAIVARGPRPHNSVLRACLKWCEDYSASPVGLQGLKRRFSPFHFRLDKTRSIQRIRFKLDKGLIPCNHERLAYLSTYLHLRGAMLVQD